MPTQFNDILSAIQDAIDNFNSDIPSAQRAMYQEISAQLKRLDTSGDTIKATVANLKIVNSIKQKMLRLILTDKYIASVKEFADQFNVVTTLQNEYWKTIEQTFKPGPVLAEIKAQSIDDAVNSLTESGIGANISDVLTELIKTNVTSGGSYKALQNQLLETLTDTNRSSELLTRYSKQITTDTIQQYNATYTHIVSGDIGFEWYAYQGTDIATTRPFCDAMTDRRYFHISEVPDLLEAKDLYYTKDGKRTKVPIYAKTGLPQGMIEGTNPENFFIRRGGYNCGHQIRPVSEQRVPLDIRDRVYNSVAYQNWKT